jgi:hypothetical protein
MQLSRSFYYPPITLFWAGASGTKYECHNFPFGAVIPQCPGVYVLSRLHQGVFYSVYVGESDDLSRRVGYELAAHHKWRALCERGATHVSVCQVLGGKSVRLAVEFDLRHGLKPPLNDQ